MFAFIVVSSKSARLAAFAAIVLVAAVAIALSLAGHDLSIQAGDGLGWGGGSAPTDVLGSF